MTQIKRITIRDSGVRVGSSARRRSAPEQPHGLWLLRSDEHSDEARVQFRSRFPVMNRFDVLLVVLSFAAGLLVGAFVLRERKQPVSGFVPAPTTMASREIEPSEVSQMSESLLAPNPPDPTAALMARLEMISDLNASLTNKFVVSILNGEELNEDFVRLFELSASDASRLKAALAAARAEITRLESQRAQIEPKGNGKFAITIRPFPLEGGAVYDRLNNSIRAILGEERYPYYQRLSAHHFTQSSAFGMFGLSETVINVQPMLSANGDPWATMRMSFDQEKGTMIKVSDVDPDMLLTQFPLIHQRMINEKRIAAPSSKATH